MAKYKAGDKVRILDVNAILFGDDYWRDGDITEVVKIDGDGDLHAKSNAYGGTTFIIQTDEFHAIEKVSENTSPFENYLERIGELEARVEELEASISVKSEGPIITPNMYEWKDGRLRLIPEPSKKSANELRKEAIEKAKEFVDKVVARGSDGDTFNDDTGGNDTYQKNFYAVDFVVHEEKRTVVALVYLTNYRGDVVTRAVHKGIAKCNPDDVFNADIGKAIAIGRAFGLDVIEFEMAPHPSEVVAGMVVKASEYSLYVTEPFLVKFVRDDNAHEEERGWIPTEIAKIVSDTEAKY